MVHCNNDKCMYQTNEGCELHDVYYIERLCVSFRRKPRQENYEALMGAPFNPHCHGTKKGYKSDRELSTLK